MKIPRQTGANRRPRRWASLVGAAALMTSLEHATSEVISAAAPTSEAHRRGRRFAPVCRGIFNDPPSR